MTGEQRTPQSLSGSPPTRRDRSSDLSLSRPAPGDHYVTQPSNPDPPRRRSSPRAKGFEYVGGYRYHITMVTKDRIPAFAAARWAHSAARELERCAGQHAFELDAYCVMPDHVHALVAGDSGAGSSLGRFVHRFKQTLGYEYKMATGRALWQRSFFDHVLRTDEPAEPHADYILLNPVRAGLVESAEMWPYSGPRHWFASDNQGIALTGEDRSEDLSLHRLQDQAPAGEDRSEDLSLRDTREPPRDA